MRYSPLLGLAIVITFAATMAGCPMDNKNTNNDVDQTNTNANGDGQSGMDAQNDDMTNANSDTGSNGGGTNTNADNNGNANANDNGNTNSSGGGNGNTTNSNTNSNMSAFTATSNSIRSAASGARSDPEGVAPPAASTTQITWKDARGADRTMTLGAYLYQYNFSFNDGVQTVSRSANDDAYGHEGFGYVVSHNTQNGNSPLGKANAATSNQTTIFAGAHHAIYRVELTYDRDKEGGGQGVKIPVVIEWLVATGRDHPLWSVTWKMGNAANPQNVNFDAYRMDVRGPYGSLNYDGAPNRMQGDAIGGVAWGDFGLQFKTDGVGDLTLDSGWTYNTPNSVAFTRSWTSNVNAEMGIVQTRTSDKTMGYQDRVVGRERGATSATNYLNRRNCSTYGDNRMYSLPCVNGWSYQLMNYDWSPGNGKPANEATGTKLMAWGSPYGWLGASSFDLFDYSGTADGRGDRSYATFIVLGPKGRFNGASGMYDADGDVVTTIREVEALGAATIANITTGVVATQAPAGPGASQMKTLANGYNDTYAAFYLEAAGNAVSFNFVPAAGKTVHKPIFVIRNYTSRVLPKITVNGAAITVNAGDSNSGAFVSLNETANELWVTLNQDITTGTAISIAP